MAMNWAAAIGSGRPIDMNWAAAIPSSSQTRCGTLTPDPKTSQAGKTSTAGSYVCK
jgi:hypothetical protein